MGSSLAGTFRKKRPIPFNSRVQATRASVRKCTPWCLISIARSVPSENGSRVRTKQPPLLRFAVSLQISLPECNSVALTSAANGSLSERICWARACSTKPPPFEDVAAGSSTDRIIPLAVWAFMLQPILVRIRIKRDHQRRHARQRIV